MFKRATVINGCPFNFVSSREYNASNVQWASSSATAAFLGNRLDYGCSLQRRDLYAHYGCVNAIEFSDDGCLLVSGGDDRRVLLWNVASTMSPINKWKIITMKEEHRSNIFCLGFDSANMRILSAGNDEQVIIHDITTKEVVNVFLHQEAIYGVSINPLVSSVFASAGEDGQILIFDSRSSSGAPFVLANSYDAFHSVQFHPHEPTFIISANSKEGVVLWDVRKPKVPCIKYGSRKTPQSSMCARFNSNGSQIIALRRRMHPILFNTCSSAAVCEFDADYYYNSCTMKSCCFAGPRDQYVLSGSDDFNLYMWKIPNQTTCEKAFVPEAHIILKGHRSIVNQVRFNVHNFTIASSGVEKIVKLWCPFSMPGSFGASCSEKGELKMTRKVYTHDDYIRLVLDSGQTVSHDYSQGNTDEDPKMMAFFDSLVQREVEGWTTNSDHSDEKEELDSDLEEPSATNTTLSSSSQPTSQSDDESPNNSEPYPLRRRGFVSNSGNISSLYRLSRVSGIGSDYSVHGSSILCSSDLTSSVSSSSDSFLAQGNELILRLIAKKRAQLKLTRRKRRHLKMRQKLKTRKFFKRLSSSRSCTFHPENVRSNLSSANITAPMYLFRRRQSMAPYTVLSIDDTTGDGREEDDSLDSDEEESDTESSKKKRKEETELDRVYSDLTNGDSDIIAPSSSYSILKSSADPRKNSFNISSSSKMPLRSSSTTTAVDRSSSSINGVNLSRVFNNDLESSDNSNCDDIYKFSSEEPCGLNGFLSNNNNNNNNNDGASLRYNDKYFKKNRIGMESSSAQRSSLSYFRKHKFSTETDSGKEDEGLDDSVLCKSFVDSDNSNLEYAESESVVDSLRHCPSTSSSNYRSNRNCHIGSIKRASSKLPFSRSSSENSSLTSCLKSEKRKSNLQAIRLSWLNEESEAVTPLSSSTSHQKSSTKPLMMNGGGDNSSLFDKLIASNSQDDDGALLSTPDSGISVNGSAEKKENISNVSSTSSCESDSKSKPLFKKKRIPAFRLKNYRSYRVLGDDEKSDDDISDNDV